MSMQTMAQFSSQSHPAIFCSRTKRPYNLIFLLNALSEKGEAPTTGLVDCSPGPWLFKFNPSKNPHASCLVLIGLGGTATVTTHTATFVDSRPRAYIKEIVYRPQLEEDGSVTWTQSSIVKRIPNYDPHQALYVSDYSRYVNESPEMELVLESIKIAICALLPATAKPTRVTYHANRAFVAMVSIFYQGTRDDSPTLGTKLGIYVARCLDTISREILGEDSVKGAHRATTLSIVESLEDKETDSESSAIFKGFQQGLMTGFTNQ